MKPFITTIVLFFITIAAFSQASKSQINEEKSKLESFTLKTGSLIKKEFITIGTAGKVEVSVLKLVDMVANTSISGIRLEATVYKSYGSSTVSCFLDSDEIDALVKAGNLLTSTLENIGDNYTEYVFTSRDGFQAGAYMAKKEWKYFLKLERFDSDSNVFLEKADFQKLIDLISQAKSKL